MAPEAVGLPAGRSRRNTGLRREELAELAGLSVDYIVRPEQGRAANPSAQVVGSLARALQLERDERDHLYRLAALGPPSDRTIGDHTRPECSASSVGWGRRPWRCSPPTGICSGGMTPGRHF
ncbi:helix-turn-helix transcriptional regulator [Streptomyces parvulus]|uniref:helix-turn-helix domain-containing protein n=1 Tax=Streptomyces parvulus TaxID=146923 RepID=UPI002852E5CA|nr:helix-turn-helix transcriptional regulator [Streptomyces parvulus]